MTIQTNIGAVRRTLSLSFGSANTNHQGDNQPCSSPLSEMELRNLVAAMVD